jgi:predicted phage terminase large subunit-like protein
LNDYSVCTTWGLDNKHLYLLDVFRKRLDYPELRRIVKEMAERYSVRNILIEDKASGTQLIQDLNADGVHTTTRYQPEANKVMRMYTASSMIENGFVHIPENAPWLPEYIHEMSVFDNGKYNDQVDSTSQALNWVKAGSYLCYGLLEYFKQEQAKLAAPGGTIPESMPCPGCDRVMSQRIPGDLRCAQCGAQWPPPGTQHRVQYPTRTDILNGMKFGRF